MARMLDSVVWPGLPPPSRPDALTKEVLFVGTRGGEYESGRRESTLDNTTLRAEKEGRLLRLPPLRG
jgi:hypothetical protein